MASKKPTVLSLERKLMKMKISKTKKNLVWMQKISNSKLVETTERRH